MKYLREPVGIFDSGIGGLTVLKALREKSPGQSFIYIGDTARLPYGTKSREAVIRYSENLTKELLRRNVGKIIIACNTASTHALEAVQALAGAVPVTGMIEPACRAALAATKNNHIGIIGTKGTIKSGVYQRQILSLRRDAEISAQATQLLVALAEEGWINEKISKDVLRRYLEPLFDRQKRPDTLILGCTHFPLFERQIAEILGPEVRLIDSGKAAACEIDLDQQEGKGGLEFYVTDDPSRFASNAALFFGHEIPEHDINLIDF